MTDIHAIALDYSFVVRAPDPLAGVVEEALAAIVTQPVQVSEASRIEIRGDGQGRWVMHVDDTESRPMSPGRTIAHLLEHINARAADSLRHEVPLHAAAVAHPDGGVIALAGSSGSGKSTLGAAAVGSGWGFVAEEVAAVGVDDLVVRSYHRPIGLRAGGAAAIGVSIPDDDWFDEVYPWPVPPESRRSGGALLGIALVQRNDGDSAVDEVRPARALVELVEHTVVPSPDRIVPVFRLLDELVRAVPVVRVSVGAPASALRLLDELGTAWRT
jgi:hypothetical protein